MQRQKNGDGWGPLGGKAYGAFTDSKKTLIIGHRHILLNNITSKLVSFATSSMQLANIFFTIIIFLYYIINIHILRLSAINQKCFSHMF